MTQDSSSYLLFFVILASFFVSTSGQAQAPELPASLQDTVRSLLDEAQVPGASIVVIEDGQVRYSYTYGVRDVATGDPVTEGTIFRAGSISKSFTSIAIMQLVEAGKLDLNTPVSQLVPDLVIDNPWSKTSPVRVVHLLEHTAGLNDIAFRHYLIEGSELSTDDAVQLYAPYLSRWRPGTRTSYSNAGPVIAGRIVELVSGQRFEDYMIANIIGPLQMSSARWTRTPDVDKAIAKSYFFDGSKEEPFVEIAGRPSGSLNVTARDLARLPMLMLGRGTLDDNTLFSARSAERIERPSSSDAARKGLTLGYALGNDPNLNGKTTFYGHDGSIDGFAATARYSHAVNGGYVIMINQTSGVLGEVAVVLREYLERNAASPLIESVPIPENLRANLNGQFQTSTPRRSFLAPLIGLSQWQGVGLRDSVLRFKSKDWEHVGEGVFHASGESAPGLIAISDDSGFRLQSGTVTYRKVSPFEMWTKIVAISMIGLLIVILVPYTVIWIVSALRGRLTNKDDVTARLVPNLALVSALSAGIAPLMLFGTGSFDLLGKPTPVGWLVYTITLVAPFLVVGCALAFWRLKTSRFNRIFGVMQLVMSAVACVYLIDGGWFALRIWNA